MKKEYKILIALTCLVLVFSSCKEDKLAAFQGGADVYFTLQKWPSDDPVYGYTIVMPIPGQGRDLTWKWYPVSQTTDSLVCSFARNPEADSVMLIPVSVMGSASPADRKFGCEVVSVTNGKEGDDFEIIDAFIPANKQTGGILVKIKNKNLQTENDFYVIDFRLVDNDTFTTRYDSIPRRNNIAPDLPQVSMVDFRLRVSNSLEMPPFWFPYYMGRWSQKKALILMDELGYPEEELYNPMPSLGLMQAYGQLLKNYILDNRNAGNTIYDDPENEREMDWGEVFV